MLTLQCFDQNGQLISLAALPSFLTPHVKSCYDNVTNKKVQASIIKDNNNHAGIYLWYNNVTGKYYIGQAQNLGDKKSGRIFRYLRPSYLVAPTRGNSLIRNAIVKYGLINFTLVILERCDSGVLTQQEQYWINLLTPPYNILSAAKSSAGYVHTRESLLKMRGPRTYYKPTAEQNTALAERNRIRVYTEAYREMVSMREGHNVFIYSADYKYLGWYPSMNKAKLALNVDLHTVTIQRHMRKGVNKPNVLNMIWSHTPLPYNIMS